MVRVTRADDADPSARRQPVAAAVKRRDDLEGRGVLAASETSVFFGGSVVAAVVAGSIALFAPCCVSVMLPAYFAASFHNRRVLVAMTFLGLAPSLRDGAFIRIDTYRDRLRGGARRLLDVGLVALALAYAAMVDWYLWGLLAESWRLGTTSIQVSRTPLWIPQAVMAVGGLLLVVELLLEMWLVAAADEALPAGDSSVA